MRNLSSHLFVVVTASSFVFACGGDRNRQASQPGGQTMTTASEAQSQSTAPPPGATTGTSTTGTSAVGEPAPHVARRTPGAMDDTSGMRGGAERSDTSGSMTGQGGAGGQAATGAGGDQSGAAQTAESKAKAERALNDAEIYAVESAAHDGEIQMSELARKNATHAQVKQFAQTMLTDHRAAAQKAKTLAQKAKITATDNEVSNELKTDVQTMMTELRGLKGREFDRKYMDDQVTVHQRVLDLTDKRLMPNVSNAEMKTHLGELRTTLASHLSEAERVRTALERQPVSAAPAGAKGQAPAKRETDTSKAKGDTKGDTKGTEPKPKQGGEGERR